MSLFAKPQGLEVVLQEEKQRIPTIQTEINTTFFIFLNFLKIKDTCF